MSGPVRWAIDKGSPDDPQQRSWLVLLPVSPYTWTRDGKAVSWRELSTLAGPAHCDWESATFLSIGWPVGTVSETAAQTRQYIRDPRGAVKAALRDRLRPRAELPADARATGYRYGPLEVYLSPSDQDEAIYVVGGGRVERWPRSEPMALCV